MRILVTVLLALTSLVTWADDFAEFEANVQKRLNDNYRGYRTPFTGIFSLTWPDEHHIKTPVLADTGLTMLANSFSDGWNIFDSKHNPKLSADEVHAIRVKALADLPWESAIVIRKGDAPVSMAIYSAVDCGYCRRLEGFLEKQDFSYAVFPSVLNLEHVPLAKSVWCSADRAAAWQKLMLKAEKPPAVKSCKSYPITDIRYTGALFSYGSTPGIIFADGHVFTQVPEGEAIEKQFVEELRAKIAKGAVFTLP